MEVDGLRDDTERVPVLYPGLLLSSPEALRPTFPCLSREVMELVSLPHIHCRCCEDDVGSFVRQVVQVKDRRQKNVSLRSPFRATITVLGRGSWRLVL